MKCQSSLIFLGVWLSLTVLSGLSTTSFRIDALGQELVWIVDDPYTDILKNPAALHNLQYNWYLTNLSNYSHKNQRFLRYGEHYSNRYGAYVAGSFFQLPRWNMGLIGEFWNQQQWESQVMDMKVDFSDYYSFQWTSSGTGIRDEGVWTTYHNNATTTLSDDWIVTEEKQGKKYDEDASGLDLLLLISPKALGNIGFGYRLKYTKTMVPYFYSVYPSAMYFPEISHSYTLTEVGPDTPLEAVTALQEETNSTNNDWFSHTLTMGFSRTGTSGNGYDLVADVTYLKGRDNNEIRRRKQIDFDPDNDNLSFESSWQEKYYHQYSYLNIQENQGDYATWTYALNGRYSRVFNTIVQVRALGGLSYQPMTKDPVKTSESVTELMTVFTGGSGFNNYTNNESKGTFGTNNFHSLLGIGSVLKPQQNLMLGVGALWRHVRTETQSELTTVKDGKTTDWHQYNTQATSDNLTLPVGLELTLKDRYAFRLGVDTGFTINRSVTHKRQTVNYTITDTERNVRYHQYDRENSTKYSYGFGIRIQKGLQLDITGVTDITRIDNVFLSLIFTQ